MKIETDFDKDKEIIMLPSIGIGYNTKKHSFAIVLLFIHWAFSIEFIFK